MSLIDVNCAHRRPGLEFLVKLAYKEPHILKHHEKETFVRHISYQSFVLLLSALAATSLRAEITVYQNDFQSGTAGSEWTSTSTAPFSVRSTPLPADDTRQFLGYFGGDNVTTLSLSNLPNTVTSLKLSFDAYMMWSWDGNDTRPANGVPRGPDYFGFNYNGDAATQKEWTFSLGGQATSPQSYCDAGMTSCLPTTAAAERYSLGYRFNIVPVEEDLPSTTNAPMDMVYRFTLEVPHTGPDATFNFYSRGLQVRPELLDQNGAPFPYLDEAWGLDNVIVTAQVIPEPHVWALMFAGLGWLGFVAKRRQR